MVGEVWSSKSGMHRNNTAAGRNIFKKGLGNIGKSSKEGSGEIKGRLTGGLGKGGGLRPFARHHARLRHVERTG